METGNLSESLDCFRGVVQNGKYLDNNQALQIAEKWRNAILNLFE